MVPVIDRHHRHHSLDQQHNPHHPLHQKTTWNTAHMIAYQEANNSLMADLTADEYLVKNSHMNTLTQSLNVHKNYNSRDDDHLIIFDLEYYDYHRQ